jgi:hypothetical protein
MREDYKSSAHQPSLGAEPSIRDRVLYRRRHLTQDERLEELRLT